MHRRHFADGLTRRTALLCAVIASAHAERASAEASPYQARVIVAGASVHSGPGENFYPTDSLAQGDVVEVYREKPGGWLAIRPPLNSFSWIPARDLILKDGGLAEVVRDDVASRIGSRLNDRRNAAQIRLKKGEAVEVLGEEKAGGENWCKIAPPAGEFRWIQSSVVEKGGPRPLPSSTNATTTPAGSTTNDAGALSPLPADTKLTEPAAPAKAGSPPSSNEALSAAPGANLQPTSPPTTNNLAHELAAIELRLSRMAAAPPNLWNTERLERDTAQLMTRAQSQSDRDAVNLTQEKVNRFMSITRRQNQTPGNVAQATPPIAGSAGMATAASGGLYDAVGILRPVVSRRPGAPQFALVDERGQVITFVTATPDLNLQPYLGRRIGVVGNRGFMPEYQRATVTATRITPLNERVIR